MEFSRQPPTYTTPLWSINGGNLLNDMMHGKAGTLDELSRDALQYQREILSHFLNDRVSYVNLKYTKKSR